MERGTGTPTRAREVTKPQALPGLPLPSTSTPASLPLGLTREAVTKTLLKAPV